jgi:hypothetical protein
MKNTDPRTVIEAVLLYLDTGNKMYREAAKNCLKNMAKAYNVPLHHRPKVNTKDALMKFIRNGDGYNVTIPLLYFSL